MARVLFEAGDTISEDALRDWLPPEGNVGYFSGGAVVTPNYGANEVTVDAGVGHLTDSGGSYTIEPDQKTLTLPAPSGNNYIYGVFDPATDESADWEISSTLGGPSDPKLLKATVDANAQTVTLENPYPPFDGLLFEDASADPDDNGEFTRNGSDVKVYSGGAVRNLSDVSATDEITVEDNGSNAFQADTMDFQDGLAVTQNGSVAEIDGTEQVATGTVTATGGATPAVNTTLTGVSSDQLVDYDVRVTVDADPSFDSDYAFNFDYGHAWDDSDGEVDINLTVTWDTDPGGGNDVTLRWEVLE